MNKAILYLSHRSSRICSVRSALEATGHDVVSTTSATEAIALLFLMQSVVAIVLNEKARKQTRFDIARSLRAVRPQVPIIVVSHTAIDPLPDCVDACVSTGQPIENVTSAIRYLLNVNAGSYRNRRRGALQGAK